MHPDVRRIGCLLIVAACLLADRGRVLAQSTSGNNALAFGPGTIVGRIIDKSGLPVDSAEIRVTSPARKTYSSADGAYRLIDIKAGKYEVTVRKFGYLPHRIVVSINDKGGFLNFTLDRSIYGLPMVVTTATRRGLSGIVADSTRRPITNARITVLAENHETRSDSTGAFYVDLKPGQYMVRVTHSIFSSRLVSVTIPSDQGRNVEVYLYPAVDAGAAKIEAFRDMALKERLVMRNAAWSRILTREYIEKVGAQQSSQLAMAAAVLPVAEDCIAIIDGGRDTLPLWAVEPREIEVMEVYTAKPPRQVKNSLSSMETSRGASRSAAPGKCGASIYIWLRR